MQPRWGKEVRGGAKGKDRVKQWRGGSGRVGYKRDSHCRAGQGRGSHL